MRLPEGLRGPPEPPGTWWLAGAIVLVVVIFVVIAMPWHEVGQRVYENELPRPRFHSTVGAYGSPAWGEARCIDWGGYDTISVDRRGRIWAGPWGEQVAVDDPEAWIRQRRENGVGTFVLRAHRQAPWSAAERLLGGAARAGQPIILLQIGTWHFLRICVTDSARAEEATIASVPLPDPEGTLAKTRERKEGPEPILRLDLATDPDVESVLHALECYAAGEHEGSVRLAVRR